MGMVITDPELDDITTIYLTSETTQNQNRFWFHKPSMRLYFSVDYDIDDLTYPTSELLTIEAVDNRGATGTAEIIVTIAGDNIQSMCAFACVCMSAR